MTTADAPVAADWWAALDDALFGLHDVVLERSTQPHSDSGLVAVCVGLRDSLERVAPLAEGATQMALPTMAMVPARSLMAGRQAIAELLAPQVVRELASSELLLLARVAHVLSRVEAVLLTDMS